MEKLKESLTVVFLGDQYPPTKFVLLKRASKRWGGDLYTGIGGHQEPGEDISTTAYRELQEETGITDVNLSEFARCFVSGVSLHYFWGILNRDQLPECNEGELEWAEAVAILEKDIIPSTLAVVSEWKKREFSINQPWTMYLGGESDAKGITRNIIVESIKENLVPILT